MSFYIEFNRDDVRKAPHVMTGKPARQDHTIWKVKHGAHWYRVRDFKYKRGMYIKGVRIPGGMLHVHLLHGHNEETL